MYLFRSMDQLPINCQVKQRLEKIRQLRGRQFTSTNFMAICLWKSDSDRFQIDFHDIEKYAKICYCSVFIFILFMQCCGSGSVPIRIILLGPVSDLM